MTAPRSVRESPELVRELRDNASNIDHVAEGSATVTLNDAGGHAELLERAAAEIERGQNVSLAARAVLAAAAEDVGIVKLSEDDLHWICPKCEAVDECKPDCTRNALLGALDDLEASLRASEALSPACKHDGVILDSMPPYCGTCGEALSP